MTVEPLPPTTKWASVVAVWVLTIVGAVLVGVFTDRQHSFAWLGIVMAASILAAMSVQLATREKQGFVTRLAVSVTGSFLVLAIATGVLALVRL